MQYLKVAQSKMFSYYSELINWGKLILFIKSIECRNEWGSGTNYGDFEQMKAGRKVKFIYITHFIHKGSFEYFT